MAPIVSGINNNLIVYFIGFNNFERAIITSGPDNSLFAIEG